MSKVTIPDPVAWVRQHPDGALTAEFLEDAVISPVRKESGAWLPMVTTTQAEAYADARVAESQQWQPIETHGLPLGIHGRRGPRQYAQGSNDHDQRRIGEAMKYVLAAVVAMGIYYTGWTHGKDSYRQSTIVSEEMLLKLTEERTKLIKQYVEEICKRG